MSGDVDHEGLEPRRSRAGQPGDVGPIGTDTDESVGGSTARDVVDERLQEGARPGDKDDDIKHGRPPG